VIVIRGGGERERERERERGRESLAWIASLTTMWIVPEDFDFSFAVAGATNLQVAEGDRSVWCVRN
jgi:hypothetical protein